MGNVRDDSVVACVDGSTYTEAVLRSSLWVAKKLNTSIGLLHAHDTVPVKRALDYSGNIGVGSGESLLRRLADVDSTRSKSGNEFGNALLKSAQDFLNECNQCHDSHFPEIYKLHRHEKLKDSILHVHEHAAMLVLGQMGDHEHSGKDHIGSQLEITIRTAKCPVLVTCETFVQPKSLLFAYDNRDKTNKAIDWLTHSPLLRQLKVHIVMVAEDTIANKEALRAGYAKLSQAGLDVTGKLLQGSHVADTLYAYQDEHNLDMMVGGAFGHSRIYELVRGSNTHKLLNRNNKLLLLLK